MNQQVCAEIRRYDIHGGRTFRLPFDLPREIVKRNGPRFRVLSNIFLSLARDMQSFKTVGRAGGGVQSPCCVKLRDFIILW